MRYGIKTVPEHTSWQDVLDIWRAADDIPVFESGWNWDHFYPLTGDLTDTLWIGTSQSGELASASTRSWPVVGFLRRSQSSAATTTTASFPCTVTRWGPFSWARRTSSLNRALASATFQLGIPCVPIGLRI